MERGTEQYKLLFFLPIIVFLLNGFYKPYADLYLWSYLLNDAISFILLPILVVLLARKQGVTLQSMGIYWLPPKPFLKRRIFVEAVAVCLFVGFVYLISHSIILRVVQDNLFAVEVVPAADIKAFISNHKLLCVIYFSASAAIVEELFFRGYLYHVIGRISFIKSLKWRNRLFVLLSSIVFALIHWEQGLIGLWGGLIFGLLAAQMYVVYGYLMPLVLVHFLVDFRLFSQNPFYF